MPCEVVTIGYGGKKPQQFFAEIERLQPCLVVDVRYDPHHAFNSAYTLRALASRIPNYEWLPELGNKSRSLPPEYVNEEEGFKKLRAWMKKYPRIVLLCAERDENRCHRKWIKEKLLRGE
jgi:uncharacterized protein (DUF488 family)